MKYVIDRIIDNIAVLEAINNKSKIEVDIKKLPSGVEEGTVLIYKDNTFFRDINLENERRKMILEKFNKVRKKTND